MHQRQRKNRRGFTLIEVLLVLVILGVIGAMVVPSLLGTQKRAMIDAARASIKGLEGTLSYYAKDHEGEYPQGGQDALDQLLNPKDAQGNLMDPYIDADRISDPWKERFYYEYPNNKGGRSTKPAIWSSGPNRRNEDGSGDDINNWDEASGA